MLKQGLAKTQFYESYQRNPWKSSSISTLTQWPTIHRFIGEQRLSYIDYALAHSLLARGAHDDENAALFLCHLSLATKEGHLCIIIENETLSPSVIDLWRQEGSSPLSKNEAEILTKKIIHGSQHLPSSILTIVGGENVDVSPQTPICCVNHHYYLQKYWYFENSCVTSLNKHLQTTSSPIFDPTIYEEIIRQKITAGFLLKEQANGILSALIHPLTLIAGGPGTGKTYTVGELIQVLWTILLPEQKKSYEITLAAPTGKAAGNLQKSLSRVAGNLEGFPSLQAKTLHSLLKIRQNNEEQEKIQLTADLLIVDESSMIDAKTMSILLTSLKPHSRLILLGDPFQLPSVEAGGLFYDFLNCSLPGSGKVELKTCLRAEIKSLITFAEKIKKGVASDVLKDLKQEKTESIRYFQLSQDPKETQTALWNHIHPFIQETLKIKEDPLEQLSDFQTFKLLSPLRQGPFGVESINQMIWGKVLQLIGKQAWIPIPIMITVNDYQEELFNGETGVLIRRFPLDCVGAEDYALFPPRQGETTSRIIPALRLPPYEHAYCLSIHKSQGSEFDHIILILPEGSQRFGREILYTGMTRARKKVDIWGQDDILVQTIERSGHRLSGIEKFHNKKEFN